MRFNIAKCHILTVTRKRQALQYPYHMHSIPLERVSSASYLGITISHNLSWVKHIGNITSRAKRTLGLLRRNLKRAPLPTKVLAYNSLVRPTVEYSSVVWDPHTAVLKTKLEAIQRRAARFVFNNTAVILTTTWQAFQA